MQVTIFGTTYTIPRDLSRFSYRIPAPIHGCWVTFYDFIAHPLVGVRNIDEAREVMVHSRGLPYLQWEIQLAIKDIRRQDPPHMQWTDFYFITHILGHSRIPMMMYGKTKDTPYMILGMDFRVQWSKDGTCWQYMHESFGQTLSSPLYMDIMKPSGPHWFQWINTTVNMYEDYHE